MSKKIKHTQTNAPVCPHCGHEYDRDQWSVTQWETADWTCDECEERCFAVKVKFDTRKANR
jgi:hypothetical protein